MVNYYNAVIKRTIKMFFAYGEKEITYLKQKDKRLAEIIDKIGMIEREVDTDLFSAVIHHIIGQQISTKAQATIWKRMKDQYGIINAANLIKGKKVNKIYSKRNLKRNGRASVNIALPIGIGNKPQFFHIFNFIVTAN